MKVRKRAIAAIVLSGLLMFVQLAVGQNTDFVYQGNLSNNGTPTNGTCDFEFALFDAVTGGNQIGSSINRNGVNVAAGVFAVTLNFGDQFTGPNRFLEIRVRVAGSGGFTTLGPRQNIASAPYAMQSLVAQTALNAATLNGLAASNFIQNTTNLQTMSNFNIGGTGNANIFNATTQYNIGSTRVVSIPGVRNTFVGTGSGTTSPSGIATDNAFFGFNTGAFNNLGARNSFFGSNSGQLNTNGGSNSFFGTEAGMSNTTGNSNSFFGDGSGKLNTTGNLNSFFGTTSGDANTSGSSNSFFGSASGGSNTTGSQNAFFGRMAGNGNVAGLNNSFFGFEAGKVTTSNGNSFFGSQAGLVNTTGANNVFLGLSSGAENTVGNDNVFLGVNTGRGNTTGIQNTFIGRLAGRFNTTGERNTFVGYNAGIDNNIGRNITLIGAGTNVTADNLEFATAIGAGTSVSESNTVVVGRGSDTVRLNGITRFGANRFVLYSLVGLEGGSNTLCYAFDSGYDGYNFGACSSNSKFTSNVSDLTGGLELVKKLRPVSFEWKATGTRGLGLLTEDVNSVEPALALKNRGELQTVDFNGVTAALVSAVQTQQATLESQQKEIETQRAEIERLRSEVKAFKNLVCSQNPLADICKEER